MKKIWENPTKEKLFQKLKKDLEKITGGSIEIVIKRTLLLKDELLSFNILLYKEYIFDEIGFWDMITMPGCCGILISMNAIVMPKFRNKKIGKLLNQFRIDYAKEMGYGVLLCTDVSSNSIQQKILTNNGWEELLEFQNPRTKNKVKIHAIKLDV